MKLFPIAICLLSSLCVAPLDAAFASDAAADTGLVRVVDLIQSPEHLWPEKLILSAGQYIFRVHNHGVKHAVALQLFQVGPEGLIGNRIADVPRVIADSQDAQTPVVALSPGRYAYRSAENPTPFYMAIVE